MTSLGGDITGSPDAYAANLRGMKWSVGLMTGTVLDGMIDVAAIRTDGKTLEAYGAWGDKVMYGKKMKGIIRSTVVIGRDGKVAKHWPKVSVKGHVDEVVDAVKALQ